MPKDYFREEGETQGKSVRNIPISVHRTPSAPRTPSRPRATFSSSFTGRSSGSGKKILLWGAALLALVALGFASLTLLGSTTVTVTPRSHTVVFDETATYTAVPEGSATAVDAALVYRVVQFSVSDTASVPASGTEKTETSAKGDLIVYNDFSAEPVRLIKNTRFETPAGLVYRIKDSVVVPGKTSAGPGSLTITVYADQAGEKYNSGPVEKLTLPGLKTGAPDMYPLVYATAKSGFSGGLIGERPIVAEADLKKAEATLKETLQAQAESEAQKQVSSSDFAFPQLMNLTYDTETIPGSDGAMAQVQVTARGEVPVFSEAAFAQSLALATSADAQKNDVRIRSRDTFTVQAEKSPENAAISFTLSGTATFIWAVDTEAFATELAGKDKAAFENILAGHPEIDKADALVRPFWSSTFPQDPSSIIISVQEPN